MAEVLPSLATSVQACCEAQSLLEVQTKIAGLSAQLFTLINILYASALTFNSLSGECITAIQLEINRAIVMYQSKILTYSDDATTLAWKAVNNQLQFVTQIIRDVFMSSHDAERESQ